MVLKQRFQDGRTNYTDIGDDFMYTQFMGDGFKDLAEREGMGEDAQKDCLGFIHSTMDKKAIPIYKNFQQWVYSNNGKLFMTLS